MTSTAVMDRLNRQSDACPVFHVGYSEPTAKADRDPGPGCRGREAGT
jgi:protoporphyrinogen oxidase